MSLDLYERETAERLSTMAPVQNPEPAAFDGFVRGTGLATMRGFAKAARAIDMLGAVGPITQDAFTGGTTAQERYFKEHDEVWGSAVDYWTPKRGEVGVAGEVTGQLLSVLPMVFASPGLAVGSAYLDPAEELAKKNVDAKYAQAVGALQATGLGLGIWMPILGQNLWQRVLVGGVGFNVLQGTATRGASQIVLSGTPAEHEYKAFDGTMVTLDALLGAAFGGFAHINPSMRAQGKETWDKIDAWAQRLSPEDVAAIAVLREAEHLNVDSTPGKPASEADLEAHVERMRTAMEQMQRGEPVRVDDIGKPANPEDPAGTAPPQFEPDPARLAEMHARAQELLAEAEAVRKAENLPDPQGAPQGPAGGRPLVPEDLAGQPVPAQATAIGDAVAARLRELGLPTEEATANGAIWRAFFRTAAEKYGVEPSELMTRYGMDISRFEGPRAGAFEQGQPAARFHDALAGADEMFRYPRVASSDMKAIAEGVDPDLSVRPMTPVMVRSRSGAMEPEGTKGFEIIDPAGNTAEVMQNDKGEVWVNLMGYRTGKGGSAIYSIVGNYAHENGLRFIGDPTGLSAIAMYRRTEAMLSSALKFGTTRHLEPHPAQLKGAEILDMAPLKWTPGDDEGNVRSLLQATYGNVAAKVPELEHITYDPATRQFLDATDGQPVTDADFERLASESGGARAAQAGSSTLKRAALAGTLLREAGGRGPGLLAEVLRQSRSDLAAPTRGIYYQRAGERPTFYSALERAVETTPTKAMPAQGWKDWLRGLPQKGVKADEIKWSGIEEWLDMKMQDRADAEAWNSARFEPQQPGDVYGNIVDAKGNKLTKIIEKDFAEQTIAYQKGDVPSDRVTKEQVQAYLQQNGVKVTETMLGGGGERTLGDTAIADDVRVLREAGFTAETNPEDGAMVAFGDQRYQDIISAEEIRAHAVTAREEANATNLLPETREELIAEASRLEAAASAAERIERHWMGVETPVDQAVARMEELGYRVEWAEDRTVYALIRTADGERFLADQESIDAGVPGRSYMDLPEGPVERAATELFEAALSRQQHGEGEMTTSGTKFGQYTLPGAKEGTYRELLLTLPAAPGTHPEIKRFMELDRRFQAGNRMNDHDTAEHQRLFREIYPQGAPRPGEGIPRQAGFQSGHFDEANILAHVRFNERTDADGKRVLFVEEIQSDWAQQGKKKGFIGERPLQGNVSLVEGGHPNTVFVQDRTGRHIGGPINRNGRSDAEIIDNFIQMYQEGRQDGVPAAPFVGKTDAWVGLTMKRTIRYAAEHGFDRVAWTTGEQQVGRYTSALRKAVDAIEWTKTPEGVQLVGYKGGGRGADRTSLNNLRTEVDQIIESADRMGFDEVQDARRDILRHNDWVERWGDGLNENEVRTINNWRRAAGGSNGTRTKVVDTTEKEDVLSDAIGKAMADRIINDPNQAGTIEGENIKIDDTGMASFYDRIVPSVAKDVLKKLGGGKITPAELQFGTDKVPIPEMRTLEGPQADAFQGAEDFPSGERPVWAETKIRIGDGANEDVTVLADRSGVHIIDGEANEFGASWHEIRGGPEDKATPPTAAVARELLRDYWQEGSTLWVAMRAHDIESTEFGPARQAMTGEQLSFEITPAMRAKALEGQPLFQPAKGQIQFTGGRTIIDLFKNADASTFPHETGHLFLEITKDLAARPDAPEGALQDWATIASWLKVEGGEITREQHEQFARGFEAYLMEGKAPSEELRGVFQRFRDWLIEIYHSIAGLRVELNDDVRGIMDRMLASQAADASATRPEGPQAQRSASSEPPPPPGEGGAAAESGRPTAAVGPREASMTAADLRSATKKGPFNFRRREATEELARREAAGEAAFNRDPHEMTDKQLAKVVAGETYGPALKAAAAIEADRRAARTNEMDALLQDPAMRETLGHLADDAGWAQIGGRYDPARAKAARAEGETGVVAFTEWIPKAEWWTGRPEGTTEAQTKAAVRKAMAGEKLGAAEKRILGFLVDIAHDQMESYRAIPEPEARAIEEDWATLRPEDKPSHTDVAEADLTARAAAIDEAAVERAAQVYESDTAGFLAAMRSIIDGHEHAQAQAAAATRAANQPPAGGRAASVQAAAAPGAEAAPTSPEPGTGEPAGTREQADPVALEAERFVAGHPDLLLRIGSNPDGTPVTMTAKEYLEDARAQAADALQDKDLLAIAAACMLGGR